MWVITLRVSRSLQPFPSVCQCVSGSVSCSASLIFCNIIFNLARRLNDRARIREQNRFGQVSVSPSRLQTTVLFSTLNFAIDRTSVSDIVRIFQYLVIRIRWAVVLIWAWVLGITNNCNCRAWSRKCGRQERHHAWLGSRGWIEHIAWQCLLQLRRTENIELTDLLVSVRIPLNFTKFDTLMAHGYFTSVNQFQAWYSIL